MSRAFAQLREGLEGDVSGFLEELLERSRTDGASRKRHGDARAAFLEGGPFLGVVSRGSRQRTSRNPRGGGGGSKSIF